VTGLFTARTLKSGTGATDEYARDAAGARRATEEVER
jgi:hypothetical protein